MKKHVKLLITLSLVSGLLSNSVVFANEIVPSLKDERITIQAALSRVIYTWESFDSLSFTRIMTNANGHQVPVKFERTGGIRIVNGSPEFRYVGIIYDTNYGVTSLTPITE
ncbi:hypothetical protein Q7W17_01110 [Streptococcus suis]|nr:hypothetical protein [Streptococcus suis]